MIWGEILVCNGGRSAMVFQHHCRSSVGKVCNGGGEGLQYNTGARVEVGSARWEPLAAHGVWCPAVGLNLETWQLSRHYLSEILLNVTLIHNKANQTNTKSVFLYFFQNVYGSYTYKQPTFSSRIKSAIVIAVGP